MTDVSSSSSSIGDAISAKAIATGTATTSAIVAPYIKVGVLQSTHLWVFSISEVCQLIGTAWILYMALSKVFEKIKSRGDKDGWKRRQQTKKTGSGKDCS